MVSTPSDEYDVLALRYASRGSNKASEYFRYDIYRQPDQVQEMDYFFWLVRNNDRTVLVDCGFNRERGLAKNRVQEIDPIELLARVDVKAQDVDHVVISHLHYDHVGNVDLFPNATFSIAREEYDFWSGTYGSRELMKAFVIPEELQMVQDLNKQERLHFIDGSDEIFPGVVATLSVVTPRVRSWSRSARIPATWCLLPTPCITTRNSSSTVHSNFSMT